MRLWGEVLEGRGIGGGFIGVIRGKQEKMRVFRGEGVRGAQTWRNDVVQALRKYAIWVADCACGFPSFLSSRPLRETDFFTFAPEGPPPDGEFQRVLPLLPGFFGRDCFEVLVFPAGGGEEREKMPLGGETRFTLRVPPPRPPRPESKSRSGRNGLFPLGPPPPWSPIKKSNI